MEEDKTEEKDDRPEFFSREWMAWFAIAMFLMIAVFTSAADLQDNVLDNPYLLIAALAILPCIGAYALIKHRKKKQGNGING